MDWGVRMKNAELDWYTDYLLSSFGSATATGLSQMVQGAVSHDKVTRFLSGRDYTSKDLWMQVKAVVRQVEDETGVLIFDDTIQEKVWTDESDLICWHYDHCVGRTVKGINLLNALYHCKGRSVPVAFELVQKPLQCDLATREVKRKSEMTKNEMMREMIRVCLQNALKFRFVLMDSWFSSEENFEFITGHGKDFIAALNKDSLEVIDNALVEPSVKLTAAGTHYQFLRVGYFVVDPDTTPDHLVFNRVVGLRDSWAKVNK